MFGYVPSIDLQHGDSIRDALVEDFGCIKEIIKPTHYNQLDIVTSGLKLQGADIVLPNDHMNNSASLGMPLLRLKKALQLIEDQYDLIVLDCAPNHASVTMNALIAATGIILPINPSMPSYGSSIHFVEALSELTTMLGKILKGSEENRRFSDEDIKLLENNCNDIFRVLITNDPCDNESQFVVSVIRKLFGNYVMNNTMSRTIALSRTSNDIKLLYDQKKSEVRGSKGSFDRGMSAMESVNQEILNLLTLRWGKAD